MPEAAVLWSADFLFPQLKVNLKVLYSGLLNVPLGLCRRSHWACLKLSSRTQATTRILITEKYTVCLHKYWWSHTENYA